MGIFDIIELKQHVQALGEYLFYIDAHCEPSRDALHCHVLMTGHLKSMLNILAKFDKD